MQRPWRRGALSASITLAVLDGASACTSPAAPPGPTASASALAQPRQLAGDFVDAFNDGDAARIAGLFADDAEFVNIYGMQMSGRSGIESGHRAAFASRLDRARLVNESVRVVPQGNDVSIVELRWALGFAESTPAEGRVAAQAGTLLFTAKRGSGGTWTFIAGANVADSAPPS